MFSDRTSEISFNVYKSGWEVLVHHLEMDMVALPNFSASHLPVEPVSANAAFIRFNFCCSVFVSIDLLNLNTKLPKTIETAKAYAVKHSRFISHRQYA